MEHGSTTGLRLCLKQQKEINAHSRFSFSFSFIFFPLSRIDISNILSFDFISFKRTSIILLSQILFSTHLFFLSVFCFEVPTFCFFIHACVGSFRPIVRTGKCIHRRIIVFSAMLFESAMSLF